MAGKRHTDGAPEINATAASLLGFLARGPQSGYALAAAIENSIGNFWNVTRSQIYRELRTLDAAGYAVVGKTGTRDMRPYAITPLGQKAFEDWIARQPAEENIRFPLLLTTFFGDRVQPEVFARMLRDARELHELRLVRYQAQLEKFREAYPFPARTLEFGCRYEQMVLDWIATLEKDGLM